MSTEEFKVNNWFLNDFVTNLYVGIYIMSQPNIVNQKRPVKLQ